MNTHPDPVLLAVLLAHAMSTLMMTGLIWFVQIVHYPLMSKVGGDQFSNYELAHTKQTTWGVGPLMLTELATAIYLLGQSDRDGMLIPILGLVCLGVIWGSTLLLQIPAHRVLEQGFDPDTHRRLVRTNWIRTIMWTSRSMFAAWMLVPVG
ncbi:MAG: hypothetical protein P1U30_04385 [Phycisphaerales bacterium]|nr:hypothetical protein [Phycisphaerales bacterium]